MLNINKTVEDGAAVFTLEGRLDTVTSPDLEAEIKEVLPDLKEITIDIENLDYISSAGLRVLLSTQKVMNRQGSMTISHVNDTIMKIFEVTGFSEILTIE